MKASTPILTILASTLFTTILANPVGAVAARGPVASWAPSVAPRSGCSLGPCDQCPMDALWGIFPNAEPPTAAVSLLFQMLLLQNIPHETHCRSICSPLSCSTFHISTKRRETDPENLKCFNSYSPAINTIGCPCTFDDNTTTTAIVGYSPNLLPLLPEDPESNSLNTRSHVEVTWTATDVYSGIVNVNVYSAWRDGSDGLPLEGFPLIGSLPGIGFNVESSETFTVWTTLPDPLTFTVERAVPYIHYIDVSFTYGNQTFNIPYISSDGQKKSTFSMLSLLPQAHGGTRAMHRVLCLGNAQGEPRAPRRRCCVCGC